MCLRLQSNFCRAEAQPCNVQQKAEPELPFPLQPVTQVVTPTAYATGYTSVTTKFDTGREQFTAFYPCAAFASDCILTAHLYYAWGMHGILPGARDALFSVQVRFPTASFLFLYHRAFPVLGTACLRRVWQLHLQEAPAAAVGVG
jgi:hypothetical protein